MQQSGVLISPERATNEAAERLARIHRLLAETTSSPWAHDALELVMATVVSPRLVISQSYKLVWLLVEGNPAGGKTSTIMTLGNDKRIVYVDNLTENAIASGYVPENKKDRKPDLLGQLEATKAVALVIKDLTSLLSGRDDRVAAVLGDLNSIYDGTFTKWTGTMGGLAYTCHFAIVAAVTPAAVLKHHRHMARIGTRFLTYRMPSLTAEQRQAGLQVGWVLDPEEHNAKVAELRRLVEEHVAQLLTEPLPVVHTNETHRASIDNLAHLLSRGRGLVQWRRDGSGGDELEIVQVEEPFRAQAQLRTLGEALALIHGRTEVTDHEVELLRRVTLSSMPSDRAQVVALFRDHPTGLTVAAAENALPLGEKRIRQLLEELRVTDVITSGRGSSTGGAPAAIYSPLPEFIAPVTDAVDALNHREDLGDFSSQTSHTHTGKKKGATRHPQRRVCEEKWGLLDLVSRPLPARPAAHHGGSRERHTAAPLADGCNA